jgi:hypothetical protein
VLENLPGAGDLHVIEIYFTFTASGASQGCLGTMRILNFVTPYSNHTAIGFFCAVAQPISDQQILGSAHFQDDPAYRNDINFPKNNT